MTDFMNTPAFRPINRQREELFQEIRRRILRLQSGKSLDSMERVGADTQGQIGASFLSLRTLARNYAPDYDTALLLWGTGCREEQIVACLLFPPERLSREEIARLLGLCHSLEIAEYFGTWVLSRHSELVAAVGEFLRSDAPALQTAALTAISRNRMEKKAATPFSDDYVRAIDASRFASPYVLIVYNRLRILV